MKLPKAITDTIESPRLSGAASLRDVNVESVELRTFKESNFEIVPGKYKYIDISDSVLESLNANNVISFKSTIIRVRFTKSQLTGLQLPEGNFKDVTFENCRINLSNFRNSTFERCLFRDCDLTDADFSMCRLTFVEFISCQLQNIELSNCKNTRIEFTDCSLNEINAVDGLRGSTISNQNLVEIAPLLAAELNIGIKS